MAFKYVKTEEGIKQQRNYAYYGALITAIIIPCLVLIETQNIMYVLITMSAIFYIMFTILQVYWKTKLYHMHSKDWKGWK